MVLRCCCKLYEHISYTHVLYLYGHDTGYCTVYIYIYMYFFIHASYIIYSMLPVVVVGVSYLCPSLPGKVRSPSWLDPICLGRGETTNLHIYYLHLHRSIFVYITIHICLSLNILAKVYIIIHIYIYTWPDRVYIYMPVPSSLSWTIREAVANENVRGVRFSWVARHDVI